MTTGTTSDSVAKKDTQKLQRAIVDGLEDVKAQDIQVYNTEHLSPLFERVVLASGTSNRQTRALASSVLDAVRDAGFKKPRVEGQENGEWIIVDCGQAVVHIMQPAIRQYYHLEELWGEKPVRLKFGADKPVPAKSAEAAPAKKAAAKKALPKTASGRTINGKTAAKLARQAQKDQVEYAPERPELPAKRATAKKAAVKSAAPAKTAKAAPKTAAKTESKAPVKTVVVKPASLAPKKAAAKSAPAKRAPAKKAPAKKATVSRG